MKISELREFINKIPREMDDFQLIYRKFEYDGNDIMLLDYPLITFYVDEEMEESIFLDEDGWNYFKTNLLLSDDEDEIDE
jgi:hypothetical protein